MCIQYVLHTIHIHTPIHTHILDHTHTQTQSHTRKHTHYAHTHTHSYIYKYIPKTKTDSYSIPNTNTNPNTPVSSTMATIIITKPYNIPVTNTFQYPNKTIYKCRHHSPNTKETYSMIATIVPYVKFT